SAPRNRKYEYLVAGKIRCICGRRRTGEASPGGRYRYYRCSDRVLAFPLPRTCHELCVNAQLCDRLVWGKIAELMTSPVLLLRQIRRWAKQQNGKASAALSDTESTRREVGKLHEQSDRLTKAYAAGLLDLAR